MATNEAGLFGINNSNRSSKDLWGKNCFNSSFPVALANYMKSINRKALYIKLDENLKPFVSEISIDELYNSMGINHSKLYFSFESKYDPYQSYAYETIDNIDLVIKNIEGKFLRPLEVKLTVLPDNSTFKKDPIDWGAEIVIRPASTSYCALGIAHACKDNFSDLRTIFEADCAKINSWSNPHEVFSSMPKIVKLINDFETEFLSIQKPFILQPVWKTCGQSPYLDEEHALDLFVWSDLAFTRLFIDNSLGNTPNKAKPVSRQMRSTARLVRCLFEISRSGKVKLDDIYKQMTFGHQTDKEFSVNGNITNSYMKCDRLKQPLFERTVLRDIILNGGEKLLKPERRFDQSIYFTMVATKK